MSEPPSQPVKRPRLSLACNECRRRKVRCDTGYPKCRNCQTHGAVCLTTDVRRPGVEVTREWTEGAEHQLSHPQNTPPISKDLRPETGPIHATPGSTALGARADATVPLSDDISPPVQHDTPILKDDSNGKDQTVERVKILGGSSSQSLTRSLDVYLKAGNLQPVSSGFRYGMKCAEEMEISPSMSLPQLPESPRLESLIKTFFERIHPLYPMFDIARFREDVDILIGMPSLYELSHNQIPLLASAYLVASLSADEQAQDFTDEGIEYLRAATSLLGRVILVPYLTAVQALLLFTLCFRGRNKDGVGWRTLAMAIRISQTLGLHRSSAPSDQVGYQHRNQLIHSRIWAVCCSFEKTMQLEVGWPSMIDHFDPTQILGNSQPHGNHDFISWLLGLAHIQGRISHHIYGYRPGARSIKEILPDIIELDRALLSWARGIPEECRPGNDLFVASHEFHACAFLSIQYYQTMITLHRTALVSPSSSFAREVELYCSEETSKVRLQNGEAICLNSARAIANMAIELSDRKVKSRVINAGPLLLACVVIGISLVKTPGRKMQAADMELLKACIDDTADQYQQSGQHPSFVEGIHSIYKQTRAFVSHRSQPPTERRTWAQQPPTNRQLNTDDANHTTVLNRANHQMRPHNNPPLVGIDARNGEPLPVQRSSTSNIYRDPNTSSSNTTSHGSQSQSHSAPTQSQLPAGWNVSAGNGLGANEDLGLEFLPFDNFDIEGVWNWMMEANVLEDI